MSTEVKNSIGTKIKIGSTYVAKLTKIGVPKLTKEKIDVTTLDSAGGYREYIGGFRDSGELDIEGYATGDAGQTTLKSNYESDDNVSFTIEFSNGRTCTFDGYVSEYEEGEATMNEAVRIKAKLTVSGVVDYAEDASTGWSAFILRNAADDADATNDAYAPTVAAGTLRYAVTFDTLTSVRPKATAASHTIKLYVDDVYVEDLTSGTSGTAIAFSAGQVKKLTFKAWEDGKTPKYYEMMVHRTA